MHLCCLFLSKNSCNLRTLVCKIFGLKIRSCNFFDKSQVWPHTVTTFLLVLYQCLEWIFEVYLFLFFFWAVWNIWGLSWATSGKDCKESLPNPGMQCRWVLWGVDNYKLHFTANIIKFKGSVDYMVFPEICIKSNNFDRFTPSP